MESSDTDVRIAVLEQELAELRAARPRAERPHPLPSSPRRRAWTTLLALSLFATSLPVATWLHMGAREESARVAQKREQRHERKLQRAQLRWERTMRFVDAALDDDRSREDRESALRFLSEQLGETSQVRAWARKELRRMHAETATEPQPTESPCHRRRHRG
jgi:hypothetical protein